jgi:hypothetical protein
LHKIDILDGWLHHVTTPNLLKIREHAEALLPELWEKEDIRMISLAAGQFVG